VTKALNILESEKINAAHYDLRFVKPLDEELLHEVFAKYEKVITVEDGCVMGGMGSAVIEFMADHQYHSQLVRLGIPDNWVEHGEPSQLYEECGYSPEKIAETAINMIKTKKVIKAKEA